MPYTVTVTPKQLRAFLKRHQLTQSGAARELGIDPRTMRRYVADGAEVPRLVELALIGLVARKEKSS
jgi:Bacterial regulatory protein, Fis family